MTGPAVQTALDDIAWPVRTERLVLRTATPQDAGPTWDFRRLEPVNRWLTRTPQNLAEYREHFLDPESLAVTVVVELDGAVIGDLMLRVEDAWTQAEVRGQGRAVHAELGWALHPDHTGRGYATEAVRELLRVCFHELGLRRVTASCFAANEASWRLMERVGMRRELHAVRESLHRSGDWLDVYGYALLAEEWDPTPTAHAGRADARRSRVPETAMFVAGGHVSVEGS
ncbi:GNAT family N-acetyltransferase [Actinotalea sp.]|uniref:GNAT family N-acetyltransferase n=1 Tax=Actinotalea sp. TaxID=1872145 RepID=UPI00356A327C